MSLGSLLGTAFGALVAVLRSWRSAGWTPGWLVYVLPGVAIVWIAHRDNIERLLAGTERRFDPGDRQPTPPPGGPLRRRRSELSRRLSSEHAPQDQPTVPTTQRRA